jgi:hypothetical protein
MGHVKQKKSTSSSTSTPPEPLAIEVNYKDNASSQHRESRYPEQLNAEELISQINCSRNVNSSHNNEVTNNSSSNNNDSNNNNNSNSNNAVHRRESNAHSESVDIEKGSERRNSRQKPLFRRLFSFIRSLWIGAKFNVGKAGKSHHTHKHLP